MPGIELDMNRSIRHSELDLLHELAPEHGSEPEHQNVAFREYNSAQQKEARYRGLYRTN